MSWYFFRSAPERGFTLIELLVVIAIIGLLSSIVLASLSSARVKSRDARRLEDLKQMANTIQLLDKDPADDFTKLSGTWNKNLFYDVKSLSSPDFKNYVDPVGTTPCSNGSTGTCQYSIHRGDLSKAPTPQAYEICAYLEGGSGSLAAGPIHIGSDTVGSPVQNCNL
jgi:prepilin-type N-terminal cleavage/methylation domain-containing protein